MNKRLGVLIVFAGMLYPSAAQLTTNNAVITGGLFEGAYGGGTVVGESFVGTARINGLNARLEHHQCRQFFWRERMGYSGHDF